jgi:hypothetical protein
LGKVGLGRLAWINLLSPFLNLDKSFGVAINGGIEIAKLNVFYIVLKGNLSRLKIGSKKDNNMSKVFTISREIDVIPFKDNAVLFLKIYIHYLLLHKLLIIS